MLLVSFVSNDITHILTDNNIRMDQRLLLERGNNKALEKTKALRKLLGDNRELIDKYKRLGLKNSKINELIRNYRE